ncbi:MAG: hypothetical protein AAFY02_00840 [Pseudomonadota bacterium]
MPANLEKYRAYLDGLNLDAAQQAALIHSLWDIMESFADRGFGLHPVQQVPAIEDADDSPAKALPLDWMATQAFEQAAGTSQRRKGRTYDQD